MKKRISVKTALLASAAIALAAGASAGTSLAYFTTYASAGGRVQVALGFPQTDTQDDVRDWTKHVSIENTGERECFVRVRILAGEKYRDSLIYSSESDLWVQEEDGYWYYRNILEPGTATEELLIRLDRAALDSMTEPGTGFEFNVIVVQENTAVLWAEDGSPYGDWENGAEIDLSSQEVVAQ